MTSRITAMSLTDNRVHKVKCNYGVEHYYAFYKKTSKNPVNEKVYRKILNDYLKAIRNAISNFGYTYTIPEKMGEISIRKVSRGVSLDKDGKVKNDLPINWKATKALWEENPIAKEKRIRIRYTNEHSKGYVFTVCYFKGKANFKNKTIYKMQINRELRRNTYKPIMSKRMDAFIKPSNYV